MKIMTEAAFILELASHPQSVAEVEPYVNRVLETYHVDHEMYGNILISLTEAVTNAIVHGNKEEEAKKVQINIRKEDRYLTFCVTDEGKGFNYDNLPDPTAPENLLKLGGRGIFLMRQLADLVIFSREGSTVELQFKL